MSQVGLPELIGFGIFIQEFVYAIVRVLVLRQPIHQRGEKSRAILPGFEQSLAGTIRQLWRQLVIEGMLGPVSDQLLDRRVVGGRVIIVFRSVPPRCLFIGRLGARGLVSSSSLIAGARAPSRCGRLSWRC